MFIGEKLQYQPQQVPDGVAMSDAEGIAAAAAYL